MEHRETVGESVQLLLEEESKKGMDQIAYYRDFAGRVDTLRRSLVDLLWSLKRKGETIAAYGAAAKATTLLSYCQQRTSPRPGFKRLRRRDSHCPERHRYSRY